MNIDNKIVVVTGASSGIGLATVKLLASRGAKLALVSRSKDKLDAFSRKISGSIAVPADMTKENDIKNMIKSIKDYFGRIDILINCAGQGYDAPVEKTNIETFRHIFDLDVLGPLIAMQQVIPLMRNQGGGAIINISSGTALMKLPNNGAYSSIKRALVGLSLTAREELKSDHIAVTVVYPYMTLTNFEKNTIKDLEQIASEPVENIPFPPDNAEFVAQKILEGIENEKPEIFAHEWMEKLN